MRQRLAVALAHEQIARIRSDGERRVLKAEKRGIHAGKDTALPWPQPQRQLRCLRKGSKQNFAAAPAGKAGFDPMRGFPQIVVKKTKKRQSAA